MIRRTTGIMTVLALLGFSVCPAAAYTHSFSYEKTALSGQEIFLYGGSTLNPDCSKAGKDDLRAISGPSHGKLMIMNGKTYAHYAKKDARAKCDSRKVDGIKVVYRSAPGFKGRDEVTLSLHTYYGYASRTVIRINVE
ncbi:MAG: hypothetical protein EOS46_29500 [Mesorhizobium sp.]|uniref:hypothetical protein n=1 Tax=Mesorhizobium sp. TaxID=1871066 RepID=UPI000FE68E07|nr:hypothetical protein [Mesorhizobium sp.]RWF40463.1 MAG: hypothetical protein EOS46_29500 [Mesorhizobium sp.]